MDQQVLPHGEESSRGPGRRSRAVPTDHRDGPKPNLFRRRVGRASRISHWDPEDQAAWEAGNKTIARRNLLWSVLTVHLGYSVWTLWPVMELFMPKDVYGFSTGDKFLLATTATLVGACLRMPYSLATAIFGGRNWAIFSVLVLLIPTVATMVLLAHPGLPLWPYLVCAALTGLGGGNFAASMTNANAFYPHRLKGAALGFAGGAGNLGVPMIQVVGMLVIASVGDRKPYLVCGLYVVLLIIAGIGAMLFMNNIEHHRVEVTRIRSILSVVVSTRDTWVLALLYLASFGSFIGFSFAFGQVLETNFIAGGQSTAQAALHAAELAFIGPTLAAVARVWGGRLADRLGGSRVTLAIFAAMVCAAGLLGVLGIIEGSHGGPIRGTMMVSYFAGFITLFILSGLGNGSVYKMIPTIFEACSHSLGINDAERRDWSRVISGVVIGLVAGVGALGGVGIDLALRESYVYTGGVTTAFWIFMWCYAAAGVLTWKMYVRRPLPRTRAAKRPTRMQPASEPTELIGAEA